MSEKLFTPPNLETPAQFRAWLEVQDRNTTLSGKLGSRGGGQCPLAAFMNAVTGQPVSVGRTSWACGEARGVHRRWSRSFMDAIDWKTTVQNGGAGDWSDITVGDCLEVLDSINL